MKTTMIAALAATLFATGAYAEKWQRVDISLDGHVVEIDVDSIQTQNGLWSVKASAGGEITLYFDCKGHAGPFPNRMEHIPALSIVEETAKIVCAQ